MLLSRMKVKDGRIKSIDVREISEEKIKAKWNNMSPEDRSKVFQENVSNSNKSWEALSSHDKYMLKQYINKLETTAQDSITEGSKIVVNTENHENESAIAVSVNEDNCLVRFENGDEETIPIEAVSAFEPTANDANKCMKDDYSPSQSQKIKELKEAIELNKKSGNINLVKKLEEELQKEQSMETVYQDQSSSETETKINELKQNMDAARARGYDTAPYQKEIDRLKSMDANNVEIKKNENGYYDVLLNGKEVLHGTTEQAAKKAAIQFGLIDASEEIKDKYTGDPLTEKGKEIMASLKEQYGEEKGEQVFYAMKNSGKIGGIDNKDANPDGTISPDEENKRKELVSEAKKINQEMKRKSYEIGGSFRGPGIWNEVKKELSNN